jgi:hypothetical protein
VDDIFDILTQYVSWVEAVWVSVMAAGFIRYVLGRYRNIYIFRAEYIKQSPKHKGNSTKIQLDSRAFRFLVIGLIFWLWMWLGIRSMFIPNPESANNLDQLLLALLLLSGAGLLFLKGEMVDYMENKAYIKYREELKAEVKDEIKTENDTIGFMFRGEVSDA